MKLGDLLFSPDTNLADISSSVGASCGSSVKSINTIGDVENKISIGTSGAYLAKTSFREHPPYYREFVGETLYVFPTYHFITEFRKEASGDVVESTFSDIENAFYKEYQEYTEGVVKEGETLLAVETFDKWLVDELTGVPHPDLNRDYAPTHKWVKLEKRG